MGEKMKHIINYVYIFLHNNFDMLIIHRSQSSRNPFICGNCQIHLPNASVVTTPLTPHDLDLSKIIFFLIPEKAFL